MKFSKITLIFILMLTISQSFNCFFIQNPFRNWFQRPITEEPEEFEEETVPPPKLPLDQTLKITTTNQTSTQTFENLFQPPINQIKPNEPIKPFEPTFELRAPFAPPDRQNTPVSRLGMPVPVKMNRFGLEPLSYPIHLTQHKFTPIFDQNSNLNPNMHLHRRLGDLAQSSTHFPIIPIKDYVSTLAPIKMIVNKKSEDNEYQTQSDLYFETEDSKSSPIPVYQPSSAAPVIESTTPKASNHKPLYLHNEEFARQLTDLYYNKPIEMFAPMMDKFNLNVTSN